MSIQPETTVVIVQPETAVVIVQPETTVATITTKGKGKAKAKAPRGKNWIADEDIQLCKPWIHFSKDPGTGDDQDLKKFWNVSPGKIFMVALRRSFKNKYPEEEEEKLRIKAASKTVLDEDSEGSVEQPAYDSRPLGCKASKKQMKRKPTVDDCIEETSKRLKEVGEDRKKILKLMSDVLEHQKRALDFEVMSKDLSMYVDDPTVYSFFKQAKEETMIRHDKIIEDAVSKEVEIEVVEEVETEDIKSNK
ncbi:hypothetical protein BD770DRAFT_440713 [Pilaira anomala]|nr:hypothetical protein BD770DRAFT_440713 [Pilaira anomala]